MSRRIRPRSGGALRGARGSRTDRVGVFLELDPDAAELLEEMRAATGASKWLIVQTLLKRAELDEHGRPVGWAEHPEQEELPLKTA